MIDNILTLPLTDKMINDIVNFKCRCGIFRIYIEIPNTEELFTGCDDMQRIKAFMAILKGDDELESLVKETGSIGISGIKIISEENLEILCEFNPRILGEIADGDPSKLDMNKIVKKIQDTFSKCIDEF